MKEKYYKTLIFALPIAAIIIISIASYDWAYLGCLIEYQDKEDTAGYCYMHFRAIDYEYLP
jgi:hypothetical protein